MRVDRHFCGRCGSPLITVTQNRPDMRYVKAGTLDETSILAPKLHIWCTVLGLQPIFPPT